MNKTIENKCHCEGIQKDLVTSLLDNSNEYLILVDNLGKIQYASRSNEALYKIRIRDMVGRNIRELNPDTRIPFVLKSGKIEYEKSVHFDGKEMVVVLIPLFQDGRVIGVARKVISGSSFKRKPMSGIRNGRTSIVKSIEHGFENSYGSRYNFNQIIGESDEIVNAKKLAQQVALQDLPVLIRGESGTGKELFAHSIHQASCRGENNFIRVNCAGIPGALVESELFGYEAGSFTGAGRNGKIGKFEQANNGTIFLDEIGDMPIKMQVKLLRVLQEKEVERLGGTSHKPVDFRIICATNRDLEALVKEGTFRVDLYHRINVLTINLPPLREIVKDIPLYLKCFINDWKKITNNQVQGITREAMRILEKYCWPGNVRELKNVIDRAMVFAKGKRIHVDDLPENIKKNVELKTPQKIQGLLLKEIIEEAEMKAITDSLIQTGYNKGAAANRLGVHRNVLYRKIKKYGICNDIADDRNDSVKGIKVGKGNGTK